MGVGLSLSKKIVEALGGQLNIKSEPGLGTRIEFSLKLRSKRAEVTPSKMISSFTFEEEQKINTNPFLSPVRSSRRETAKYVLI